MKPPFVATLVTGMGLSLPLTVAAEVSANGAGLPVSPLGTGAIMETAWGLLLIIGLIIGLSWAFRRFGKRTFAGKGVVSVMGGVSLGPRERAVLLQVGSTRLLVGVAPGRVQTLHVLGADESLNNPEVKQGFQGQLERQLERKS